MSTPLYDKGLALRRKVLGEKHIAKRQASPDPFTQQQNELVNLKAKGERRKARRTLPGGLYFRLSPFALLSAVGVDVRRAEPVGHRLERAAGHFLVG